MSLTYSMENSSSFEVDSVSGVISANGQFDRETQSIYNLTVIAVDQGGLNATALGTLSFHLSLNDCLLASPLFS